MTLGFRQKKAICSDRVGQPELAIEQAKRASENPNLNVSQLSQVIRIFLRHDIKAIVSIKEWPSISALDVYDILNLANTLSYNRDLLSEAEDLIKSIATDDPDPYIMTQLVLVLIGRSKFSEALKVCKDLKEYEGYKMSALFNLGIAKWGESGECPVEIFRQVLDLHEDETDEEELPNYLQCLSLVFWIVGNQKKAIDILSRARQSIISSPRVSYSSWSYLYCDPSSFRNDLKLQEEYYDGKNSGPTIFGKKND